MVEINPFLSFIPANPKKLIVGSFPCFNGTDYGNWFYSGSGKNHFWKLLSDCLEMPAGSKREKMALCEKAGIALTDIAYKIERKKGNCSDSNLDILEFNVTGIKKCLEEKIGRIFFTSRFVENHFKKLFPECEAQLFLLLSPSPAANMHIGGLADYKKMVRQKKVDSPYGYRLTQYRKLLLGN